MTAHEKRGRLGLGAGVIAMVLVYAARHLESFRGLCSGALLDWLDQRGWVKQPPPDAPMVIGPPGWLSFTDATALETLLTLGLALAVVAALPAMLASRSQRQCPFSAAAFLCGVCAWSLYDAVAGFIALGVGFGVQVVRWTGQPRARPTPSSPNVATNGADGSSGAG